VLMCRKAVNQSVNQSINQSIVEGQYRREELTESFEEEE